MLLFLTTAGGKLFLGFRCLGTGVKRALVLTDQFTSERAIDFAGTIGTVDSPVTLADLKRWRRSPSEATLAIDSAQADFEMTTSCVVEWLVREPSAEEDSQSDAPLQIHVIFENHDYGKDAVAMGLYLSCRSIQPVSSGQPLSVEKWRRQFEAWWHGWEEHWSAKNAENATEDLQPIWEDALIPVGEDSPPDLSYRPPSEPPFELAATDAPAELLQPIEGFCVGLHRRDWKRMASVYPHFDSGKTERQEQLRDIHLGHEFGRWVYIRHVDSWWKEANRACVVVRGIEHTMSDEEDPAQNMETVITYGLRKLKDRWIIWAWEQGWPRYGSAPNLIGSQAWRASWDLS